MTVLIYVDTSKQVGDHNHLKAFASAAPRSLVCGKRSRGRVAFEYEVLEWKRPPPEVIFPQNYGANIGCLLSEMVNSPYALSRLSLAA